MDSNEKKIDWEKIAKQTKERCLELIDERDQLLIESEQRLNKLNYLQQKNIKLESEKHDLMCWLSDFAQDMLQMCREYNENVNKKVYVTKKNISDNSQVSRRYRKKEEKPVYVSTEPQTPEPQKVDSEAETSLQLTIKDLFGL